MTADHPGARPRRVRPTDVLKHEHRQIEEHLRMLTATLEQLGDGGPDSAVLNRVESIASYIDHVMTLHHRKEEEGLFPLLQTFLEDEELHLDGRIADHEDLRIMSGKFKTALEDCRQRANHPSGRFAAQMLRGYGLYIVHLVLEHLLKEDQILFLVADHYLSPQQEAEIFRRFESIEAASS